MALQNLLSGTKISTMSDPSLFFSFKKLVAFWLDPLSALFGLLAICFVLKSISSRFRKKILKPALIFFGSFFCLLSTPIVSYQLTLPLESQLVGEVFDLEDAEKFDYILVLACGHVEYEKLTTLDKYNVCATKRIMHAVEISKGTGLPIVFSGGILGKNKLSEAYFNSLLAGKYGIDDESVLVIPKGFDTKSETLAVAEQLKGKSVVVVTNASHIRRSLNYLERAGVEVLMPAPTDFETRRGEPDWFIWSSYIPTSSSAQRSYKALYEYLGLASQYLFE
tara:strand:+ start:615 stop:1451 length:837 start_codon:yes stop_codon:yes gene_type:complete